MKDPSVQGDIDEVTGGSKIWRGGCGDGLSVEEGVVCDKRGGVCEVVVGKASVSDERECPSCSSCSGTSRHLHQPHERMTITLIPRANSCNTAKPSNRQLVAGNKFQCLAEFLLVQVQSQLVKCGLNYFRISGIRRLRLLGTAVSRYLGLLNIFLHACPGVLFPAALNGIFQVRDHHAERQFGRRRISGVLETESPPTHRGPYRQALMFAPQ